MSLLQIDAYRNMSRSGISQLALISDGQGTRIGSASDTNVGFLKRLFNTDASKKLNIEVTRDFKAALIRAYDAKVADEAFTAVIGKSGLSGAKLSAALVSRTISMADQIYKKRLAPPQGPQMMLTMRLEGKTATFSLSGLEEFDRQTMMNAKKTLTTLHGLLMDMPTDMLALQDFKAKITAAKSDAESLINDDLPDVEGTEKVIEALRKAVSMVDGKIAEATDVCNNNPVTYKALTEFTGKCIDGAMRAISNIPNNGGGYGLNDATKDQLMQTLKKFTADDGFLKMLADSTNPAPTVFSHATDEQKSEIRKVIPQLPQGASLTDTCPDPKAFVGKDFIEKLARYCTAMVMQDLKAHVPAKDISFESSNFTKDIAAAIQREVGNILNEGNWDPIEKDVTFSLNGVALKGKSVITPASHMGGAMTEIYKNGPKGYNCQSFGEATHAVNLAHSEFKVEINGQQQTIFSGIRHGVHAAVAIESQRDFKAANSSRAKETLIAAFTSNPALVKKALANPSEPCKFVFNSVSLLTPDFARNIFGSKYEDEKTMLNAQTEAYQGLNGKPIEVDVTDSDGKTVKVTIEPIVTTFNYGVNWGGVGGLSALFGGWGASKDMNAKGLVALNKFAETTLAELGAKISQSTDPAEKQGLQKKADAIRTLLGQINRIDQKKTYSSDRHEAYKMASRIAVLTNLLGGVPAWNCKSGKDRTGMMDVECKFLATLVALGKNIPEPGAPLTSEQKMLYRNLLLQSGNHEMQKYNTGVAGYKLEGVGSITERIGDIASQGLFLGGSKIVNS